MTQIAAQPGKTEKLASIQILYFTTQLILNDYSLDHYYRLAKSRLEGRLRHIRC